MPGGVRAPRRMYDRADHRRVGAGRPPLGARHAGPQPVRHEVVERYALCEEVAGKSSWRTGEEYGGEQVTVTADFISFVGDAECIRFRSRVFLQADRYASNALIREAIANHDSDKMAEGSRMRDGRRARATSRA